MQRKSKARVSVEIALFTAIIVLITPAVTATAQVAPTAQSDLALMTLPSSINRGEGGVTAPPAGGAGSTFAYRYDQTHDARLEAAVKRALLQLGRTCGGDVLRSTVEHPAPASPSLTITVVRSSA